jgi:hypothetical protein
MDDEGARALAAHPEAFASLETLDVSDNYLSDEGLYLLKGLGCAVVSSTQEKFEEWEEGEHRYVSAWE